MALEARPDLSDRQITQNVGVHHNTVGSVREAIWRNTPDAPRRPGADRRHPCNSHDRTNRRVRMDVGARGVALPATDGSSVSCDSRKGMGSMAPFKVFLAPV